MFQNSILKLYKEKTQVQRKRQDDTAERRLERIRVTVHARVMITIRARVRVRVRVGFSVRVRDRVRVRARVIVRVIELGVWLVRLKFEGKAQETRPTLTLTLT